MTIKKKGKDQGTEGKDQSIKVKVDIKANHEVNQLIRGEGHLGGCLESRDNIIQKDGFVNSNSILYYTTILFYTKDCDL